MMAQHLAVLLAVVVVCALSSSIGPAWGVAVVTDLDKANIDEFISEHPVVMVEFYAPWCGHCKRLAPEYERAARILRQSNPDVRLARVDCTHELAESLDTRYAVTGFPTIKVFHGDADAETSVDYNGERVAGAIVEAMREYADPDWAPPQQAVLTLTADNFDATIASHPLILVEFYAPWCGHCKQLAPVYEEAALLLKELTPPVPLAKIDATAHEALASKYEVQGYPTLKVFRNGRAYDYTGERGDKYQIAEHMRLQRGSGAKELDTSKVVLQFVNHPTTPAIVGIFPPGTPLVDFVEPPTSSKSDILRAAFFKRALGADNLDYRFGHVSTLLARAHMADLLPADYDGSSSLVLLIHAPQFRSEHEPAAVGFGTSSVLGTEATEGAIVDTGEALSQWFKEHRLSLVGEMQKIASRWYKDLRPLVVAYYDVDFSNEGPKTRVTDKYDLSYKTSLFWLDRLRRAAVHFRDQGVTDVHFAVASRDGFPKHMDQLGFGESTEDVHIGVWAADGRRYPMVDEDGYPLDVTTDAIIEHVAAFRAGELKPFIMSQRAPKQQAGPVVQLVATTIEDAVHRSGKDVLVDLYAPWCTACREMEPTYERLAKRLQGLDIIVASMDATRNDVPTMFDMQQYPSLYYVRANDTSTAHKYEVENFEYRELLRFVQRKASVSLRKKRKGKGKKTRKSTKKGKEQQRRAASEQEL